MEIDFAASTTPNPARHKDQSTPTTKSKNSSNPKPKKTTKMKTKKTKLMNRQNDHNSNTSPLTSIRCFYTNATSLNSDKIDELTFLTQSATSYPHIIFISETWFQDNSITALSSGLITNYTLYRRNRSSKGGGVAIYCHNDIESCEIDDADLRSKFENLQSEQIWCTIKSGKDKILTGCIYRPPPNSKRIATEINQNHKTRQKHSGLRRFQRSSHYRGL